MRRRNSSVGPTGPDNHAAADWRWARGTRARTGLVTGALTLPVGVRSLLASEPDRCPDLTQQSLSGKRSRLLPMTERPGGPRKRGWSTPVVVLTVTVSMFLVSVTQALVIWDGDSANAVNYAPLSLAAAFFLLSLVRWVALRRQIARRE